MGGLGVVVDGTIREHLGGGGLILHIGRTPSLTFPQNLGKCKIPSVCKVANSCW